MNQKLSPGNSINPFIVRTILGKEVSIPDREGRWIHLQFRRFPGYPICNLHLQTFIRNHRDVEQAGISEVVFFHSSDASLLPYQGHFPFDVVGEVEESDEMMAAIDEGIRALDTHGGVPIEEVRQRFLDRWRTK